MKRNRLLTFAISIMIVFTVLFQMAGCAGNQSQADLSEGITPCPSVVYEKLSAADNAGMTDFAVRLLSDYANDGENVLLSPVSVIYALAMTANGAEGETRAQMEKVLGMPLDKLNPYLHSYMENLPQTEKSHMNMANSVWFNDRIQVKQDFLQLNADYYGAELYKDVFNDGTADKINKWVSKKTEKMIPEIIDRVDPQTVMFLINALSFDAEWENIYTESDIHDGIFTKEDGTQQNAKFMRSDEYTYLEDKNAEGFMKYYSGHKYAFAAMMPRKGVSLSGYVKSLDGQALSAMLAKSDCGNAFAAFLPKFETGYETVMNDALIGMGMPRAFDRTEAEFGKISNTDDGNIYINRVIHKTFISVYEKGTKAGAATAVEMYTEGTCVDNKEVWLDRPFVYMIVDCENMVPLFIGTMTDIEK